MKHSGSALVIAALTGLAAAAHAEGRQQGYTNADIKGGYGCGLHGSIGGSETVATAQFEPRGNGKFADSEFTLHINNIGVCSYALNPGSGTYDVNPNGTGQALGDYSILPGSAQGCPMSFSSRLSFVCSGVPVTASTCDIATLSNGSLLSGTCTKQNK